MVGGGRSASRGPTVLLEASRGLVGAQVPVEGTIGANQQQTEAAVPVEGPLGLPTTAAVAGYQ